MIALTVASAATCALGAGVLEQRLSPRFLAGARPRRLLVGFAGAAVAAAVTVALGARPELPAYVVLVIAGVVLARIDLAVHRLPNVLTRGTLALGTALLLVASLAERDPRRMLHALGGAVALYLIYAILALLNRAGLGRGDVRLAPVLGLYAGWLGLQAWEVAAMGAFLVQGAVALGLLFARRVTRHSDLAYGPAMLLATLAAVLAAPAIASGYLTVLSGRR